MSNKFNEALPLERLLKHLGLVEPADGLMIGSISDSNAAEANSLCDYVAGPLPKKQLGLVLMSRSNIDGYRCILVDNPQEMISSVVTLVQQTVGFHKYHPGGQIDDTVSVGENVVIEDDVKIGPGTILEHNVVIHSGTRIGSNCLIRTHTSIGGDGFGFFRNKDGVLMKQPHVGGVLIGNNVEIGSNSCVVRGIVNDTIINDGAKIDNLVHIAHDCFIDVDALVIACAEISGYVKIGKRSRIAPNSCVKQRVAIGDDVLVGIGAVVIRDVLPSTIVVGNPAKPL